MKALDGRNNVKVYNLSAGKSLPDWLTDRKRRKLSKRDVDFRHRIELIQDFTMPDLSGCVRVSPDGRYIITSGTYKPRIKCYEVAALSQKFERCFDAEVIHFDILSEDYSKLVFLQEERYVEFHNQGGRWFRTRIPKFGRDMAYHYPCCDLYIAASGSDIYRLNLNQGRFLNSLQTDSPGINKCAFNKVHYLLACGTEDGKIEAWDPRSRHRVGVLDTALHIAAQHIQLESYKSVKQLGVTALAYNDALTLGVGTHTGQILLYDIRSDKPLLVKDHNDGYAIKDLEFHSSGYALSMSTKVVKIWDRNTGEPHTSIESGVDYNDLCVVPDSGMLFLATEDPKLQTYFLPSLGPAPKWCSHLDALIEELEEEVVPSQYDDYKFVTEDELKQIGLHDLIGSSVLRAVMHGYYIDVRLYNKAKLIANPFDFKDFLKRTVTKEVAKENQRQLQKTKLPNVNQEMFERLLEDQKEKGKKKCIAAEKLLQDDRFKDLFAKDDFDIDKDSYEFKLVNPVLSRMDSKKKRQKLLEDEEEREFIKARDDAPEDDSSDVDSILSDFGEDSFEDIKHEKMKQQQQQKQQKFRIRNNQSDQQQQQQQLNNNPEDKRQEKRQNNLTLTAVTSISELKPSVKKLSKMSLEERLDLEQQQHQGENITQQHTFGSRIILRSCVQ
ncbi:hypothetical protein Pmani_005159 [Petrolisthes manimaculis]|uniref:Nucleolar protein 10 n=1 Tax=Petrolisthes manimaculis TaxID=1843537 RepID=A0AAE1UKT1_9EUCA|nr:hypothetical protein Pmani_005159 [Petrolisthes manimaculis]